jgi:thiol-disulfide isomerase/thioredoxin
MKIIIPLFLAAAFFSVANAQQLKIGDPAPALATGEFVQGEPIKGMEKGKAYLIEFWATWCGPCVKAIPHVNELHVKYADKGLVVIGQNVWERDEAKVKPFLENMADKMTYRVAMDDKSDGGKGRMAETWMKAAGRTGIPAAFLVNREGVVAWIGHPASINDELVTAILDGTYDLQAQAEAAKKNAERDAALKGVMEKFKTALGDGKTDEASAAIDELEALGDERLKSMLPMMRMDVAAKRGDGKAVGEQALAVLAAAGEMPNKDQAAFTLFQTVSKLCSMDGTEGLDRNVAVQLCDKASELTEGKNVSILEITSRAKFLAGDKAGAITALEEAIKVAPNAKLKERLEETLAKYRGEPAATE